jgi:chromosome segregation protein
LRIKKLELFGFKSFKDRTVIQFDAGITGIVGPNGCGKSNIVDALVWVMGEMSAKHLRGSSMEDVIFAGADGYAPMGMAEVSLTLENDGGPFPALYSRFSEIMVTRRLHRSGESEYLINKEPSRLRDVQEIFMDTGAGSKGFSIIEQGAIGKIITAKPEDRRNLIEEAAGITKFKVRKRESQRKLESTDQNLVRLQDIVGEQKRQIDSLERQAQRAERYRKIKTELQEKDIWVTSQTFLKLRDESVEAESTFNETRSLDAGSEGRLAELEARVSALRLELTEKEAAVQTRQKEHRDLLTLVQETEFRIRELNLSIDQARRSNEMTGSILSQYTLRRENLETEKSNLADRLVDAREELVRLENSYSSAETEYSALQARIHAADQELTDKRRELLGVQAGGAHLETREGVTRQRVNDETKKLENSKAISVELKGKKIEFEQRRNKVFQTLENERQTQLDLTKDVDLITQNLGEIRRQLSDRKNDVDQIKDELNQVASRLYGLENLQSNFEGFEEGVKNVMLWQRAQASTSLDSNGDAVQFKPLAEVVEVPAQYEMAMEASLGARLQVLLADSSDRAMGAVDYLKEKKNGRSSFLSGDVGLSSHDINAVGESELSQETGVQSFLKDVVSVPERWQGQVAHFLNDIVIVDSIRTALRLRAKYFNKTFVTLEGDILGRDGVLTGGSSEGVDSGVLKRRREIKELSMKREEFAGKLQLAQLTLKKLEASESSVALSLEDAKKTAVEKEILIAELRKDLERAETELGNAITAFEREDREAARIENDLSGLKTTLDELVTQIAEFNAKKEGLTLAVDSLTLELANSRVGIDEKAKQVTDLKVTSATRRQETESLEREMLMMETTLRELLAGLDQMSQETARNTDTLNSSQVAVVGQQSDLQKYIHQSQEADLAAARARNEFELLLATSREAESLLSQTMHELNQVRTRMSEAQIKLEQCQMKEKFLLEQIQERYMLDLRDVAQTQRDVPGDLEQYTRDIEELRDKIKKIGEVNLAAIQEYDDVIKRHAFLNQQHQDLTDAKENLRKVIDRINRICSRRFKETFEQVNERFKRVFPVLFGGGEAELILIENPELDEPGIDIVARPPGKKLQNVSLLSGGEKALTAVSLIFSIFLVKPSPFCLLDEVDAPLDDANVFRFNDLVKEMAKRSQIIVVTHNKHTMKENDKLYGVTMQEKGVSKMVSVSLTDAEKLAAQ